MIDAYGDRLREAFDEILAVPASERASFIRQRFADDARLRRELLQMSRHLDSESSFLEPLDATDVRALLGRASESSEWPEDPLPDLAGVRLADRYELGKQIGVGGAGVVHEAQDVLLGIPVAVKVLRARGSRSRHALRREAAALRLLRLPGVVQLLDEGLEEDRAWLVTERVEGQPFPGRPGPLTWADLVAPTTALLESLERIHRAGIVHGDLKPGNVLVRPDGVPVILDLGIAEGPRAAHREDRGVTRRGTLRYLAPEQATRGVATVRSDLFAVGVMLHEALTNEPFRSAATVAQFRIGVVEEARSKLADAGVDAPAHVVGAIDRLLAREPEDRPESAAALVSLLRTGHPEARRVIPALAASAGTAGERVPTESLRALFHGTDRLWHIPEDAALELQRRTGGDRDAVLEELEAWSRAGLGWWEQDRYHIRRSDLDHLQRGLQAHAPARVTPDLDLVLTPAERDLLLVVELAGPRATPALVGRVVRLPEGDVERLATALEAGGALRRDEEGVLRLAALPGAVRRHLGEHAAAWHRRIARALPRGDERRLMHWVAAGHLEVVPSESLAVAEALLADGDVQGARTALAEGFGALDLKPDPEWTARLVELSLLVAIQLGTRHAYDAHLHLQERYPLDDRLERLEAIAKGGLQVLEGQPERALRDLPAPEDAASELERRCAVSARLFAARRSGGATLADEIARVVRLAEAVTSAPVRAAADAAEGWRLYGEDRYEEAGRAHLAAARSAPFQTMRVQALLNAASAFLEAGAFDRAASLAAEARTFARARRHAAVEARAEWVGRSAAYRRGDVLEPDRDLVRAAADLGHAYLHSLLALNEAAVAWRRGDEETAREMTAVAVEGWRGEAGRWPRLLADALGAAAEGLADVEAAEALLAECRACPDPSVSAQAAGLLARAWPPLAASFRALAVERSADVPPDARKRRLEVLSLDEAMKSPTP